MTRGGRSLQVPTNRRHTGRRGCAYCGVTLLSQSFRWTAEAPPRQVREDDHRSWDHIVPVSCGGRLQVPACAWCNGTKGASSLSDWLGTRVLALRRSSVVLRDPLADPMQEKILLQLRDEDIARIRRETEYHAR